MSRTAFITLDIQNGVVDRLGTVIDTTSYLSSLSTTLAAARKAGLPVIHVTAKFREGYADASPRNMTTLRLNKQSRVYLESDATSQLSPALDVADTDLTVVKRRVSAFHATDLDLLLRSQGVETIVLTGLITSGAVLSTVRQGADMDYQVVVLEDLCADLNPEVHKLLVTSVFNRQGQVLKSEEWIATL
ncbi:isochorismatase family protein [Xylariales sp. PMI_506]|nr:isochorismatase family protein [Xylariales sp. PMI_506]